MNLEQCFVSGTLKRIPVEKERVKSAMELGRHYLERARGNFDFDYFDVAFLMAYNAMLQAAKAALFHAGVKERSHQCAVAFLKKQYEKDVDGKQFTDLLDTYRLQRHRTQYDGASVDTKDAEIIIGDAQHFLDYVETKNVK